MNPVQNREDTHTTSIVRLPSLDILRGICAMAVAGYHFRLWSDIPVSPETEGLLAFFGTYGVSVFFVLSGYSLAHAYDLYFKSEIASSRLARYFRRRFGRLVPLYCLITLLSIIAKFMTNGFENGLAYVLANISLLFGFVNPAATPVIGGWSIGIEVVFYILFPIIMALQNRAWLFVAIGAFLSIWISSDLSAKPSLAEGWLLYVQPANHFVFFAAGIACRISTANFGSLSGAKLSALIGLMLAVIIVISTGTQELDLVVGIRRAFLVLFSVALVASFAQWSVSGKGHFVGALFGGMSYPLYLIHPLVYFGIARIQPMNLVTIVEVFVCTCALAIAVDVIFERHVQKMAKNNGW